MAVKYPNKFVPESHLGNLIKRKTKWREIFNSNPSFSNKPTKIEFITKYWEPICAHKDWESHLDIPSFVDNFLLLQFIAAGDTLKWNSRFWKNTDGPIVAGPVWYVSEKTKKNE